MTRAFVVLLLLASRIASADAPKGYKCGPGGYRVKYTCKCPIEKQPGRDADGKAICEPKPEPAATACLADRKGKHLVKIETVPTGATLYLGAKACGVVAYTPWKGKLAPGPVNVILEHQSYDTVTKAVTVTPTSTAELYVPMQRTMMGTVEVKADADPNVVGIPISIDGLSAGVAPAIVKVRAGRHLVEIAKPGFDKYSQWVDVQDAQTLVLLPVLRAIVVAKARLMVDADVVQAEVWVDGTRRGTTPLGISDLPLGVHTVEVRKPPAPPWKTTVTLTAGTSLVRAELAASMPKVPTHGTLQVMTHPAGAEVWIDGVIMGKTPLRLQLTGGDHWMQVKLPGHVTYDTKRLVEVGKHDKMHLQLTPAGELQIASTPAGSTVYIDGVRRGLTPLLLKLPVGEHTVIVERPGYQRFQQKVKLDDKRVTVSATLAR